MQLLKLCFRISQVKVNMTVCGLTGREFLDSQLIRLVHSKTYGWCVDAKGDLPGRACWILPSAVEIMARAESVLSTDPEALIAMLDRYLLEHIQQTLSRVRRAGAFCIGGDRIKQWLGQNPEQMDCVFLLRAYDGGSVKLWSFLQARGRMADDASLSLSELGAVFERVSLGSVLVSNDGFCQILRNECAKLALLRAT